MVQNVYAEGKREVSTAQSWKFQDPTSFVCGFPADMKLSIRSLDYFGFFPPQLSQTEPRVAIKKNKPERLSIFLPPNCNITDPEKSL